MTILDLFFRTPRTNFTPKVLGGFFLILGVMLGVFFLFQMLAPIIGYNESGAIVSVGLIFLGLSLLLCRKFKTQESKEETAHDPLSAFSKIDIEKLFKENALPISLLSLIGGIILSQVTPHKHIPNIIKMLK